MEVRGIGIQFIDKFHDIDSCEDVWTGLYDLIYKKDFGDYFDFDKREDRETSIKCKRLYIKIDKTKRLLEYKKYPQFKMAGDCIFNFNDKKIKMFEQIIDETDKELLQECKCYHHRLENFSFMPITGGMNRTKGMLRCAGEPSSFDRPDVLISELKKYYEGKETRIFSRWNRAALKWFLSLVSYLEIDSHSEVEKYCKAIYQMDEGMLAKFLEMSEKPIIDSYVAHEYMMLAKSYWEYREKIFKEKGIQ